MSVPKIKQYPFHQCALYKCRNKRLLAYYLQTDLKSLVILISKDDNYREFYEGKRLIQTPHPQLKRLHRRIHDLLSRIAAPEYLHSARIKHSYLTNATVHKDNPVLHKLDIRKFFPSTKFHHVRHFFLQEMKCSPDVAHLMARLTTVNGRLPTGSPVSPLLAFYCHKRVFDKIFRESAIEGNTMTCYVDDIAISGEDVSKELISRCKKIILEQGLIAHKEKRYSKNDTKVVTGVAYKDGKQFLPNKRHKKIHMKRKELNSTNNSSDEQKILTSLIGMVSEASQIDSSFKKVSKDLINLKKKA